jgi:hypothetical protein
MNCPVATCDRTMPGTATICGACSADLVRALADVPWLVQELDIVLSRQTSKVGGGRSAETPLPYGERASDATDPLRNALVGWVQDLGEREPPQRFGPACAACGHPSCALLAPLHDTIPSMAAWLHARSYWLLRHPAVVEIYAEITGAVYGARRAIDRPPGYVYAGPCNACDIALYAKPGARDVRCRECRAVYDVEGRREWMRRECEHLLGSSSWVAMVCTGLGVPVAESTVRMWVKRGKLQPRDHAATFTGKARRPLYRVGDVIAVATGQTLAYSA